MANKAKVVVSIGGTSEYDVSLTAPPKLTLTDLTNRGFTVTGSMASVRVDSTTHLVNPKGTWMIHHDNRPRPQPSPPKVLEDVKAAIRAWLGSLGYEVEFRE